MKREKGSRKDFSEGFPICETRGNLSQEVEKTRQMSQAFHRLQDEWQRLSQNAFAAS